MKQPLKIHEAFYAKWSQTNGLTRNQLPSVAYAYIDVSHESLDICIRITDILLDTILRFSGNMSQSKSISSSQLFNLPRPAS